MKLVLLPGLDGTGKLFSRFLKYYQGDSMTIPLPDESDQDHLALAKIMAKQLPKENIVILAESFSGGIVSRLIQLEADNIKGVIFVGSFLKPPSKILITLASILPLKWIAKFPFSHFFHRLLFLGWNADEDLVEEFINVIDIVPETLLKKRLKSIKSMKLPDYKTNLPCVYIQPENDRLIQQSAFDEIRNVFSRAKKIRISGPHFILQAKPAKSAELVFQFVQSISDMQS